MSIVSETLMTFLPSKRKQTPSGWISFNAPCCHHNGTGADTRGRGGLISNADGGKPVGYITSPWFHPEKRTNIAMGYVPFEGNINSNGFPIGNFGKKYKVHLPKKYSSKPVDATVVPIPFTESFHANTRETKK